MNGKLEILSDRRIKAETFSFSARIIDEKITAFIEFFVRYLWKDFKKFDLNLER
jgi:hypothetical protein